MNGFRMLAAACSIAMPLHAAQAAGLSYDYLDLSYIRIEPDEFDVDVDGFGAEVSAALSDRCFLLGHFSRVESEDFSLGGLSGSIGAQTLAAALGAHHALGGSADVVGMAGIVYQEADGNGDFAALEDDDTGYALRLGVRGQPTGALELQGFATYLDIFDDSETSIAGRALLHLGPRFALFGEYATSDDADTLAGGVRVNF
ncbi:MAG: outer membrane beta-barrel protein [Gammaproteobacteria bacterium]|nr:outer membrane beta-barrel protein [Gammaproteobacteria bacterium]